MSEIKTYFFGDECHKCATLGIHCIQAGLIGNRASYPGERDIYIDNELRLSTNEKIKDCTAVTGRRTNEEEVALLRDMSDKMASYPVFETDGRP